jgi:hypothetical protein
MPVPKNRPQPGPGAPLTAVREQYRRLMAPGPNNHQSCLLIGVNPTTGTRWSKGRNMVDHTCKARYYPPIHAEPVAISPRYLSEEERILIGDLLTAGHSQRSVAAQLCRSPNCLSHIRHIICRMTAKQSVSRSRLTCTDRSVCARRSGPDVEDRAI